MYDVIVVLGRGIHQDGSLPIDPQSRVKKAAQVYRAGRAEYIVMSGAWTYHFNLNPPLSEAAAMKKYAASLGIPPNHIIEESQSKDTIGNVYFTKKNICEPRGWKRIIVITSDEHRERAAYLFTKIYGPSYSFEFITSDRVISDEAYNKEMAHEASSLAITQQWLGTVTPGDDDAVREIMSTIHPAYAKDVEYIVAPRAPGDDLHPNMP